MKGKMFLFALVPVLFMISAEVDAREYSLEDVAQCELTAKQKEYWSQSKNFKSYLSDVGIRESISAGGKTRTINKSYAINRCLVVYGTPYDIPTTAKSGDKQKAKQQWEGGEPRYLGYALNGSYYSNPNFRDDYAGGADYLIKYRFLQRPWNNTTLNAQGDNSSFSKPKPIPRGTNMPTYPGATEASELDRALDKQYLLYCTGSCSKGLRGYFVNTNPILGHTMRGANIVNYASVQSYPTEYTSGTFVLYMQSATTGIYWYSDWVMPAHKPLFEEVDLAIRINSITPAPGPTNQNVTVNYSVISTASYRINNVDLKFGWSQSGLSGKTINVINPGTNNFTLTTKLPVTNSRDTSRTYYMRVNDDRTSPRTETDWTNNRTSRSVQVQNPNASVKLFLSNNDSLYAKIENNMIQPITKTCPTTSSTAETCKAGTSKRVATIQVYDTLGKTNPSDHKLVRTVTIPNYSIAPTGSLIVPIPTETTNDNAVKRYRVTAQIPEYSGEVDFSGRANYADNYAEDFYDVYANLPNISLTDCNELSVNYVTRVNSNGPIKSCAGHYPKFPSTKVEDGMGVYHYVMWRFFPTPFPPYQVGTPVADKNDPAHFLQTYTLNEPKNTAGNANSFLYYKPDAPAGTNMKYRGRLMPIDATFTFSVYDTVKTNTNQTKKNVIIAFGSLAYDIPSSCYNNNTLDLLHKYGCDEIMFFAPNSQANMFERPKDATGKIDFINKPVKDTKIPYLNPGKYIFEVKANEKFRYRYQVNEAASGYNWSDPRWWGGTIN